MCAIELKPFMPQTSENILEQLNTHIIEELYLDNITYKTNNPTPLFQRIDKEAKLKEIEESKNN